ncbi:MAG TPA: diguanylate cyclase [Terriglobia bacterium]|nr:diguanylate cyclase [Terriglobia bacterium]
MRGSIEKLIQAGFALAIVVVAVIAFIAIQTTRKLIDDNYWVNHSEEILVELNSTLSTLVEAETGQRGYVITGDEQFLAPYEAAATEIQDHVARLQRLAEDNPSKQLQIPVLARKIKEKMDFNEVVIETRKAKGFEAASLLISSKKGRGEMDDLRRMIADMSKLEIELLRVRTDASEHTASKAMITMFALALLTVVLVSTAYSLMRRDVRERKRIEQGISAQYAAARALAESATLKVATRSILKALGESQDWDLGAYWTIDKDADVLRLAESWQSVNGPLAAFDTASRQMTMARGVGLPGRVWASGQPLWIPEVTQDPNFPRAAAAAQNGIRAALGFPVTLGTEVLGVMEFFSRRARNLDDLILKTGSAIGSQVGQFADRMRGEEDLKEANDKLSIWVQDLERRKREITLLSQLGGDLQSCLFFGEAYKVLAQYGLDLFPATSGGVFMIASSREAVHAVAQWGETPFGGQVFGVEDCWALRTGRPNYIEGEKSAGTCRHITAEEGVAYLCVPMLAQGESLGILHLHWRTITPTRPHGTPEQIKLSRLQLASAVGEHVGLALANLNLRETLRSQSIRDPLTNLFNRRYLEESMPRELLRASRNRKPLGAIMLDIDHFKRYNDTFGHEAGDAVLRELGKHLRSNIRGEDIACRFGGEEFMLIMPDANLEATQKRAEKICRDAKAIVVVHHGQSLGTITLSLGVAEFPDHGATAEMLLASVDKALYMAKEQGRNQVVVSRQISETA